MKVLGAPKRAKKYIIRMDELDTRVLLLHGNRQTHDIFKSRIGAFVKKLRKMNLGTSVDVEGAILYPLEDGDDVQTRGWWDKNDNWGDNVADIIDRIKVDDNRDSYTGEEESATATKREQRRL
jgi:hypothetical protein